MLTLTYGNCVEICEELERPPACPERIFGNCVTVYLSLEMRKEWQEGNEDNIKSTGTALVAEGPFLMGLVHQGHQHSVFVLDISLFLFHLALEDQVT